MMRALLFTLAALPLLAAERVPVLVELFTSEGCSSCPPADQVLAALDASAIVLSEHVDYWDQLGWRDPWSSHANTQRQEAYARRLGKQGPYTPQMVIDGLTEFNGSDGRRAQSEIARSAGRSDRVAVRLVRSGNQVHIATGVAGRAADVMIAMAQDSGTSQVAAGENQGRNLRHVAILRSLRKLGTIKKGATFEKTIDMPANQATQRVIVFLQDSDLGRVSGAGLLVP